MDTGVVTPSAFEFEYTRSVTEADYLALERELPRAGMRGRILLWAITITGFASLFSLYTIALGIVLLVAALIGWTFPRWTQWGQRHSYREQRYLHGPITYGVSHEGFWLRGANLESFSRWPNLVVWRERDDLLYLGGSGMAQVYLPVSQLRSSDVYDRVMELARHHGTEFDSPDARAQRLPQT